MSERQMGERLSITLPPEMVRTIRETVAAGRYGSASELVREALAAWQRREAEEAAQLASIRARLEASMADPRPDVSSEEALERLRALHERSAKSG